MSLDNIMSNIYGQGATQSFDRVQLLKNRYSLQRRSANIKYIDMPTESKNDPVAVQSKMLGRYKNNKMSSNDDYTLSGGSLENQSRQFNTFMYGGKSASNLDAKPVLPEYVSDPELKEYIHTFHLYYATINSHPNTILVCPPKQKLTEMINAFKADLKKNNINSVTIEASKYASKTTNLPHKQYWFDVYGHTSVNNNEFEYKVPEGFPNINDKIIVRRTNRLSNVYYFEFSKGKVRVANNSAMEGAKDLKLLARCENSFYVFKGDLPAPMDKDSTRSNVITAEMMHLTGGAIKNDFVMNKLRLRSYFNTLVRKYNNDLISASEEFIPAVGLAEVENTGDLSSSARKIAKYISANPLHGAMSILSSEEEIEAPLEDCIYDPKDLDQMEDAILTSYEPKFARIDKNKAKQCIRANYLNSIKSTDRPLDATRNFVSAIKKVYGNNPSTMFKADIATGILSSRKVNNETLQYTYDVMDSVDDMLNNNSSNSRMEMNSNPLFKYQANVAGGASSALMNTIYNALMYKPFTGTEAKSATPMRIIRANKRILKGKKCGSNKCGTSKKTKKGVKVKKSFEDSIKLDEDIDEKNMLNIDENIYNDGVNDDDDDDEHVNDNNEGTQSSSDPNNKPGENGPGTGTNIPRGPNGQPHGEITDEETDVADMSSMSNHVSFEINMDEEPAKDDDENNDQLLNDNDDLANFF